MKVLLIVSSFFVIISSCRFIEQDVNPKSAPIVLTELLEVSSTSAIVGGILEYDGHVAQEDGGVCWSLSPNPTLDDHVESVQGVDGVHFFTSIKDLNEHSTVYFRAFAMNVRGVGYGQELSFTTGTYNAVIPCSPTKNSFKFNNSTYTITYPKINDWGTLGDYAIVGSTNSQPSIRLEFYQAPVSKAYVTNNSYVGLNNCAVFVKSGGFANWLFKADSGDTVYVKKLGDDKYKVTFCNLHFKSIGTTYEFDTDGNITLD